VSAPDHAAEAERLWQAYCDAARQAQTTRALADGIAANRAWRAFLNAYLPDSVEAPKQREAVSS
jgi:hypothetical protein